MAILAFIYALLTIILHTGISLLIAYILWIDEEERGNPVAVLSCIIFGTLAIFGFIATHHLWP